MTKTIRLFIFKIIFPTLISIFQIILMNDKNLQTELLSTEKNNTIKAKNFLSGLLYNYRQLVKTDFDEGTTINTIKILKELIIFFDAAKLNGV